MALENCHNQARPGPRPRVDSPHITSPTPGRLPLRSLRTTGQCRDQPRSSNAGGRPTMRNARRTIVFLVGVSALAAWSGSAQAPSTREQARGILSQVARVRAGAVLSPDQAKSTFDELGVVNHAGQVVIAMAADDIGSGAVVWASHTSETAP